MPATLPGRPRRASTRCACRQQGLLTALWTHAPRGPTGVRARTQVAMGFVHVANEAMCRPIRALTQMRGYDVAQHVLACFGGAGGQHACAIARNLGMRTVFVHRYAGVLSAVGIALADVVAEEQARRCRRAEAAGRRCVSRAGVREATRPGLCIRSRQRRSSDRRAWQGSPRPSNGSSARLCSASASRQAPCACWLQALQAEACMRAWVALVSERLRGVPGLHSRPDPCGALSEPALCGDGRRGHDGLPARERRGCCVRDGVQVRTTVLLTRHVRWMLLALSIGLADAGASLALCSRSAPSAATTCACAPRAPALSCPAAASCRATSSRCQLPHASRQPILTCAAALLRLHRTRAHPGQSRPDSPASSACALGVVACKRPQLPDTQM